MSRATKVASEARRFETWVNRHLLELRKEGEASRETAEIVSGLVAAVSSSATVLEEREKEGGKR